MGEPKEKQQPFAHVTAGEQRFEARQDNTSVYKHLGQYAIYDHVYIVVSEEPPAGLYVWNHYEGYKELADEAMKALCVTHLNIPEPAPMDVEKYIAVTLSDLEETETFPDDWDK